ncbi:hypothetical protein ACGFYQ_30340 [Streptomyces sp. NPDC048258]|uniref:hypothetical protein n=1 Tax=Streptomyces sp. NPDC048258 TaxID=3365527 RepID=UPI003715FDF7
MRGFGRGQVLADLSLRIRARRDRPADGTQPASVVVAAEERNCARARVPVTAPVTASARVLSAARPARAQARAGDRHETDTAMPTLVGAVPTVQSVRALRATADGIGLVRHGHRVPRRTPDTARAPGGAAAGHRPV